MMRPIKPVACTSHYVTPKRRCKMSSALCDRVSLLLLIQGPWKPYRNPV